MYKSSRDIDLFYTEDVGVPVLTVENYCKWYNMYLVDNEVVTAVPFHMCPEVHGMTVVGDHIVNPASVCAYAAEHGCHVDSEALAAMTRRWFNEYHNCNGGDTQVKHFTNRNAS